MEGDSGWSVRQRRWVGCGLWMVWFASEKCAYRQLCGFLSLGISRPWEGKSLQDQQGPKMPKHQKVKATVNTPLSQPEPVFPTGLCGCLEKAPHQRLAKQQPQDTPVWLLSHPWNPRNSVHRPQNIRLPAPHSPRFLAWKWLHQEAGPQPTASGMRRRTLLQKPSKTAGAPQAGLFQNYRRGWPGGFGAWSS